MNGAPHVVFAGGGTAGHLFPGLAVAEALRRAGADWRITFAGGGKPHERQHVLAAGYEYLSLPCRPWAAHKCLRRPWHIARFLASHAAGFHRSLSFLRRDPVSVVVGLGGYASAAMARAAVREDVPLVLMEQNAIPGRVTRWLAPRAARICLAMDAALAHLPPGCPTVVTGNPVREGFTRTMVCADEPDGQIIHHRNLPAAGRRRLVVLGGTTGAASFDEHVPLALSQLLQMHADAPTWDVIHQSRQDGVARTRERYRVAGLNAAVVAWISDLPDVLRRADLVICRAGGTTLAELAVCGVPAIVVPYPHAAADHQRCNAEVFQAAGACRVVEEETFRGTLTDRLRNELENLGHDDDVRREMSRAMSQLARPEAAWAVADVIRGIVCPNVCLASE